MLISTMIENVFNANDYLLKFEISNCILSENCVCKSCIFEEFSDLLCIHITGIQFGVWDYAIIVFWLLVFSNSTNKSVS